MTTEQELVNYLCDVIVEVSALLMGQEYNYQGLVTPDPANEFARESSDPRKFRFKFDFGGDHREGELFLMEVHSIFCGISMWDRPSLRWKMEAQVVTPDRKKRPSFQDVTAEDVLHTLRDCQTKALFEA